MTPKYKVGDTVYYHGAMDLIKAKITQVNVPARTLLAGMSKTGIHYAVETAKEGVTKHAWIFIVNEDNLFTLEEATARKLMR